MQIRRRWIAAVALVLAAVMAAAAGCGIQPTDRAKVDNLVVNVIDVGQGDAILIRTPGRVTLIDTGDTPARDKLVAYIKKQGVTTIDNLVITHAHADHIGGAAAVMDNFAVKHIYDSGQPATSALYRSYLSQIKKKNTPFTVVAAGQEIDIGGGIMQVLNPQAQPIAGTQSDINNNSIVLRLVYGQFTMLLAGDAEREAETAIVKKGGDIRSQVLKSGHHGSRTSSSAAFLKAVVPEAAIISVGAGNDYHHPHPSLLKRYADNIIKVWRTDTDGTVTVTSDGKKYTMAKEK